MVPQSQSPELRDHKAWLGYVQQEGLVVSPAALVDAQVVLDRNTLPLQERFLPFVEEINLATGRRGDVARNTSTELDTCLAISDFPAFVQGFLGWPGEQIYGLHPARPVPESLKVTSQPRSAPRGVNQSCSRTQS